MRICVCVCVYLYIQRERERERERRDWLGERISCLQRRMEIPGVTERNGAKNINSINNNTI